MRFALALARLRRECVLSSIMCFFGFARVRRGGALSYLHSFSNALVGPKRLREVGVHTGGTSSGSSGQLRHARPSDRV